MQIDSGFLSTFASALKGQDVNRFFSFGGSASSTAQQAPAATAGKSTPTPAKKAEVKEEPKVEEEDMDMGGLFD